ncbi:hypothetical protein V7176_23080, partial [Cytobacillus firmus]
MIKISYLEELHQVEISTNKPSKAFEEIRSGYAAGSTNLTLFSANRLVLPFWAFISSIQSLIYIIKKHATPYTLDSTMLNLIKKSASKRASYKDFRKMEQISPEKIKKLLKQKGFKRDLTPEQLRNVAKLYNFPAGATFTVPGGGKTTEALALFSLKKGSEQEKLFIVGPPIASVAWEKEISKCLDYPYRFANLTDGYDKINKNLSLNPDIMYISYDQLLTVFDLVLNHLTKFDF